MGGLGMGGGKVWSLFSGKTKKVPGKVASINGLVNEFTSCAGAVRARWPMGLGKYLLDKLEASMQKKGVLQVDKVSGKAGNFVYVNGHAVGLSNKLNDFAGLAPACLGTRLSSPSSLASSPSPVATTPRVHGQAPPVAGQLSF